MAWVRCAISSSCGPETGERQTRRCHEKSDGSIGVQDGLDRRHVENLILLALNFMDTESGYRERETIQIGLHENIKSSLICHGEICYRIMNVLSVVESSSTF